MYGGLLAIIIEGLMIFAGLLAGALNGDLVSIILFIIVMVIIILLILITYIKYLIDKLYQINDGPAK